MHPIVGASQSSMFFFAINHFDWHFKKLLFFNVRQIEAFISYHQKLMGRAPLNPPIYNTSSHFWAKDMEEIVMLFGNILGACCPTTLLE